tara:strand:+ start:265 stop:813 length:549 start_codon:yes stop_codon:yes gene_type:complete
MWKVTLPASDEYIFLFLLNVIGDPDISYYIADLTKKYYIKDSCHQKWHESLRFNKSKRWININDLHQKRNFQKMQCIPIDFPLPYDAKTWRNHMIMMNKIKFFRKGFMKIETCHGIRSMKRNEFKKHINDIDHMIYPNKEILEAFGDFVMFTDGFEFGDTGDADYIPYVLKEAGVEKMRIIN